MYPINTTFPKAALEHIILLSPVKNLRCSLLFMTGGSATIRPSLQEEDLFFILIAFRMLSYNRYLNQAWNSYIKKCSKLLKALEAIKKKNEKTDGSISPGQLDNFEPVIFTKVTWPWALGMDSNFL